MSIYKQRVSDWSTLSERADNVRGAYSFGRSEVLSSELRYGAGVTRRGRVSLVVQSTGGAEVVSVPNTTAGAGSTSILGNG